MNKVVLATQNKGKIKEFQQLLSKYNIELLSSFDLDDPPEVIEDKNTFAGNAQKKATAYMKYTGLPALADDSGLSVDVLNGSPGVFSARFAGENASDNDNNRKLLKELQGIKMEDRTAHFTSAIALVLPNEEVHIVEGRCDGFITEKEMGENGFGYDPLFWVLLANKTYGQMSDEEKNKYSHRAQALRKLSQLFANI